MTHLGSRNQSVEVPLKLVKSACRSLLGKVIWSMPRQYSVISNCVYDPTFNIWMYVHSVMSFDWEKWFRIFMVFLSTYALWIWLKWRNRHHVIHLYLLWVPICDCMNVEHTYQISRRAFPNGPSKAPLLTWIIFHPCMESKHVSMEAWG